MIDLHDRLMNEIEKRVMAETKLNLLEKDIKELKDDTWLKEEMEKLLRKYFPKSLVEKVENVMLEEVVDVQDEKSESDSN